MPNRRKLPVTNTVRSWWRARVLQTSSTPIRPRRPLGGVPSRQNHEHPTSSQLRSPTQIDIFDPAGHPRVETADRGEERRPDEHACRREGKDIADGIVLLLVPLTRVDEIISSTELVDPQPHMLQNIGLVPPDEFGASDAGVRSQRLGDEDANRVRCQGNVVMTDEQERRGDVGLELGVGRRGDPNRVGRVDEGGGRGN